MTFAVCSTCYSFYELITSNTGHTIWSSECLTRRQTFWSRQQLTSLAADQTHKQHLTITNAADHTSRDLHNYHLITLNTRRVGRRLGLLAVAQPLAGRRYSGAGPDCCWWRGGSIFGLVCGAAAAASCQPRVGLGVEGPGFLCLFLLLAAATAASCTAGG